MGGLVAAAAAAQEVDAVLGRRAEEEGRVVQLGVGVEEGEALERVGDGRLGVVEDVLCAAEERGREGGR